jgi:hypothetical protein
MLHCLLGFAQNTLLDLLIQPASKAVIFICSLPTFLWMTKSGIGLSLYHGFFRKHAIISALLTAVIQSSLPHPPLSDAGPYPVLPMNSEETWKLLSDAGHYLQFLTAAYGSAEMAAVDDVVPPMMAAGLIKNFIEDRRKKMKKRVAAYLHIEEEHIPYLSYPGDRARQDYTAFYCG